MDGIVTALGVKSVATKKYICTWAMLMKLVKSRDNFAEVTAVRSYIIAYYGSHSLGDVT